MDMYDCINRLRTIFDNNCDLLEVKKCVDALVLAAIDFKSDCDEKALKSEAACEEYKILYNKRGKEIHRLCEQISQMKIELDDLREENKQLAYNYADMCKRRETTVKELRRCSNVKKMHELEDKIKELENVIESSQHDAAFYKDFVDTFHKFMVDCW